MILNQSLKKSARLMLFTLAIILLGARFTIVLLDFNFIVTDNDQALLWRACDDFSNGIFHTPFIYGCNYGSNLESLLAVPYYMLGMPIYYALPFSNALWMLMISIVLASNLNVVYNWSQSGTIYILLMGLMPTELYVLLFAAKGHLAGILLAMIALAIVVRYTSAHAMIIVGLLAGLAVQLNPNSIFIPLLFGFFISNFKQARYVGVGVAVSLGYQFITNYYLRHLDSEHLHKQWDIKFNIGNIFENSDNFDKYLNAVTPFGSAIGFVSFIIPVILAIVLFRKKLWFKASVAVIFFFALLFSFGVNKVSDGSNDVLFHYSRFYLAIAFCNAMLIILVIKHLAIAQYGIQIISVGMVVVVFYVVNTLTDSKRIVDESGTTYAVKKSYVKDVLKQSKWMTTELKKQKLKNLQIVVTDHLFYTESQYFSTLHLPNIFTCYTKYKSFYWVEAELNNLQKNCDIFFINLDQGIEKKGVTHQAYFHSDSSNSYFLIRDVNNPAKFIAEFIK